MEWENVNYNLGNFFDGTYFTAPENGLYFFNAACEQKSSNYGFVNLHLNDDMHYYAGRENSYNDRGSVTIDTTLKLSKNDKVHVRFNGHFNQTNSVQTTLFEGRMIARLDE